MRMNIIEHMLKEKRKLHFTLIDPENQKPEKAGEMAARCEEMGTDAIMIGGSTTTKKKMDKTAKFIKSAVSLPLIIFPNSADAITQNADHIFFMSLLNSTDRRFLIDEQIKGSKLIHMYGINPISMAYIVVSTGKKKTTVEKVAKLDRIGLNDIEKALSYALAAQYFGMDCLYFEAGSGAEKHVSEEMISKVRKWIDIPLIVGGGIKDGDTAKRIAEAGADVIVTGTAAEKNINVIKEIIGGVHMSYLVPPEAKEE